MSRVTYWSVGGPYWWAATAVGAFAIALVVILVTPAPQPPNVVLPHDGVEVVVDGTFSGPFVVSCAAYLQAASKCLKVVISNANPR